MVRHAPLVGKVGRSDPLRNNIFIKIRSVQNSVRILSTSGKHVLIFLTNFLTMKRAMGTDLESAHDLLLTEFFVEILRLTRNLP